MAHTIEDIAEVPGMPKKVAEDIYKMLHSDDQEPTEQLTGEAAADLFLPEE